MKYMQPTYTLVDKKHNKNFAAAFGPYQAALTQALDLETISDGSYRNEAAEAYNAMFGHDKAIARDAMQHAEFILDMFDIMVRSEYRAHQSMIQKWFGNTVCIKKVEYVLHQGQWYKREWVPVTVKKAKAKVGVLYVHDYSLGDSKYGLALAMPGKTNILAGGVKMEARTKAAISEQQKFIKGLRKQEMDAQNAESIRQRVAIVENRFKTTRNDHMNEATQEILGLSRNIVLCGPVTSNDENYYQKQGIFELYDLLKLIEATTRKQADAVFVSSYEARLMKPIYEAKGHPEVARQILMVTQGMLSMAGKL